MDPDGPGLIEVLVAALLSFLGWGDAVQPPADPPQPGTAVVELRVDGDMLALSPGQILSVQPDINAGTGAPQIGLILSEEAAILFGQITSAHVGQAMDLAVCGEVLMSPVVQAPILGGRIVVSGNFTIEEIEAYARIISGEVPCDPDSSEVQTK